jgi:hypothetical protein
MRNPLVAQSGYVARRFRCADIVVRFDHVCGRIQRHRRDSYVRAAQLPQSPDQLVVLRN